MEARKGSTTSTYGQVRNNLSPSYRPALPLTPAYHNCQETVSELRISFDAKIPRSPKTCSWITKTEDCASLPRNHTDKLIQRPETNFVRVPSLYLAQQIAVKQTATLMPQTSILNLQLSIQLSTKIKTLPGCSDKNFRFANQ